jgi:hypothetical protein
MSPVVVLARAKRRVLRPFTAGLNTIIIAALLWLDARKSAALEYSGESFGTSSNSLADQDPACDKACTASERHDATTSLDNDPSSADIASKLVPDDVDSRLARPVGADTKASFNAHVQGTGKSSAYPQIPAEPPPPALIADMVTASLNTSRPVSESTAALFLPDFNSIVFPTAVTNPAVAPPTDTTAPTVASVVTSGVNHWRPHHRQRPGICE